MLPGMDTRFAVNGDVRLAYDDLGPAGPSRTCSGCPSAA
jgi:hypothetical protein